MSQERADSPEPESSDHHHHHEMDEDPKRMKKMKHETAWMTAKVMITRTSS